MHEPIPSLPGLLFYKHAIAVLDDLRGRGYFRKGFEQAVREYDSVEVGEWFVDILVNAPQLKILMGISQFKSSRTKSFKLPQTNSSIDWVYSSGKITPNLLAQSALSFQSIKELTTKLCLQFTANLNRWKSLGPYTSSPFPEWWGLHLFCIAPELVGSETLEAFYDGA